MMLINDKYLIDAKVRNIITPFVPTRVTSKRDELGNINKFISFGCSGYGYDLRLHEEVHLFNPDIKDKPLEIYENSSGKYVILPPKSFALSRTLEVLNMPRNFLGFLTNKSTYARCGININNTTIQPGFKGVIVLEIFNSTDYPVKLYVNEGIANLVFLKGDYPKNFYDGVYQNQISLVLPKV